VLRNSCHERSSTQLRHHAGVERVVSLDDRQLSIVHGLLQQRTLRKQFLGNTVNVIADCEVQVCGLAPSNLLQEVVIGATSASRFGDSFFSPEQAAVTAPQL